MKGDTEVVSEIEERQLDEFNSLVSIYGDILKDITPTGLVWNKKPCRHFQVKLESSDDPDCPNISILLDIEFTPTYPLSPPLVKILNPVNIVKQRQELLYKKVRELLKEYPGQEVCFTIISELKFMMDEFQVTTETVLSLEEERERRLEKQRIALEEQEEARFQAMENAKKQEIKEVNIQLLKIRDDYDDDESGQESDELTRIEVSDEQMTPSNKADYFIFENAVIGRIPETKTPFKFKAISGFIKYTKTDLFSSVASQYIVKPYLSPMTLDRFNKDSINISYLLTEINFSNSYWQTDNGKREIQDLERELQLIQNIEHENIIKLVGFQFDKNANTGWIARILTEFSPSSDTLFEILSAAEFINWSIARSWLIQLLPAIEKLHNSGYIHKAICLHTIHIYPSSDSNEGSRIGDETQLSKSLKLCHPSYGFRILNMMEMHPNSDEPITPLSLHIQKDSTRSWMAPELLTSYANFQQKSDIWDLGVVFMKLMLGNDVLLKYPDPESFKEKFSVKDYAGYEDHASLIFDCLSKMFHKKPSKRPSALELNAVKFLRDGPLSTSDDIYGVNMIPKRVEEDEMIPEKPTNSPTYLYSPKFDDYDYTQKTTNKRRYSGNIQRPSMNESVTMSSGNYRNIGRYERDFEEIGRLGKGGFGVVVKARNKIEGTYYAIKKIKHKANKLDSLLSEVLSLARLNHQYIVRYYGTWVEEVRGASADNSPSDSQGSDIETDFESVAKGRSSSFLLSHESSFQIDYISSSFNQGLDFDDYSEDDDLDDRIVFARSSEDLNTTHNQPSNESLSDQDPLQMNNEASKSVSAKNDSKSHSSLSNQKSILYIQMEFCENNTLLNLIEQGLPSIPSEYWRLFRQLLEAVSYIHGEGFIHRDLKPTNIFIDKSNNIKLGDFGLAKNSQFYSVVSKNNQVTNFDNKDLSTVAGTMFYTANEVATGHYDEKVDIYSLGIIFFEMCYPIQTGMERAKILNNLRLADVQFPSGVTDSKFKTEKQIIRQLLDHDPKKRPSASELLQSNLLPVEHQDQIIKEALRSLADPASPWQQQVRETLFNQPYSLAKDLMFDDFNKHSHVHPFENTASDYLVFGKMIEEIFKIFKKHGAVEDHNPNTILPRSPANSKDSVYEVLDRSGSVLSLPYDLILPTSRYLSRLKVTMPKIYRHQFVYRPNIRGSGSPDKYSAINFDIVSHNVKDKVFNDAECIKVVDEILQAFPCFNNDNSQAVVLFNHSDILDAIISFTFDNIGIDEKKKQEIIGVLSQIGIDKSPDELKRYLREDFGVPQTIIKDLIDGFNFNIEPEMARKKLQKLMLDSPYLIKVENSMLYLLEVLDILKKLGFKSKVLINPLSNYNYRYYNHGIMFSAIFRVEKSRRYTRLISGGRYDELISSLSMRDITKSFTPHAVGFSLPSSFMFLLMKSYVNRKGKYSDRSEWKGSRCDVLIANANDISLRDSGFELLKYLWEGGITCDLVSHSSQEEILQRAHSDGANWIILIKQPISSSQKSKKQANKFKPLKVRNLSTKSVTDVGYTGIVAHLKTEITLRNEPKDDGSGTYSSPSTDGNLDTSGSSMNVPSGPLFNVDINQKVHVVANDAPRGRKNNKKEKWELENDSKLSSANVIRSLATSPILSVDMTDEALDIISISSIHQPDEWIKKVFYSFGNTTRSYALNIHGALMKEYAKGSKWALIHSSRSDKTVIVDLHR